MIDWKKPGKLVSLLMIAATCTLTGCGGGTTVLSEPVVQPVETTLSSTRDEQLAVSLQWVIVRDGPGSWASKADWDQYLLHFANLSDEPIRITRVAVVDSMGVRINPRITRELLVKGSKRSVQRYRNADIAVHAGLSGDGLIATGTAMGLAGNYIATYSALGILTGTGAHLLLNPATASLILFSLPVTGTGVIRSATEQNVNVEIISRQTVLPFPVAAYTNQSASFFYPIAPSPTSIEINYRNLSGSHTIVLDTREALNGLHLSSSVMEEPTKLKER